MCCFIFFFFKQKTAYEMRISDWSSDVCSSDLRRCSILRERASGRRKAVAGKDRAALLRNEEGAERSRFGMARRDEQRDRVTDRRMAGRGKDTDDAHPPQGAGVGRIDDAERRGPALDPRHRGAALFGRGGPLREAGPHAKRGG